MIDCGCINKNRNAIHCLLARLTDAVEVGAGQPSRYDELVNGSSKIRYEVEHIWADKPERHKDEFNHPIDFAEYRNRIGALLLLPKSFNASYGALTYEKKLPHYLTQNLLARSLHTQCYQHNPGFKKLMKESGLAFQPHPQFRKADIEERSQLYQSLADFIWNPDNLLK